MTLIRARTIPASAFSVNFFRFLVLTLIRAPTTSAIFRDASMLQLFAMTAILVLTIAAMRLVIARTLRLTVMTVIPAPMTSAMALPAFVKTMHFHAAMATPAPMIPVMQMAFASMRILIAMMETCAPMIFAIPAAFASILRLIAMILTRVQ
jgi:hypothetical protein